MLSVWSRVSTAEGLTADSNAQTPDEQTERTPDQARLDQSPFDDGHFPCRCRPRRGLPVVVHHSFRRRRRTGKEPRCVRVAQAVPKALIRPHGDRNSEPIAIVPYRRRMTSRFFKSRRVPAVAAGTFFVISAFILSITLPTWLSLGTGNPAGKTVTAIVKDKETRDEAARFFIEKLTEDTDGADLALFDELESTITDKLDELAANEEFMSKISGLSDEIYDYFVNGVDETKVVEAQAVVNEVVDALVAVDPEFAGLKQNVDDWEGLTLEPIDDGPNIKSIKGTLNALFWASLSVTLIAGVLYARWSRSRPGMLLFLGITTAVLGVVDLVAAGAVRSAVVSTVDETDRFANAAVPVVADSLLSPFRTIGIAWLVLGIGSIVSGAVLGRRAKGSSGAADAHR